MIVDPDGFNTMYRYTTYTRSDTGMRQVKSGIRPGTGTGFVLPDTGFDLLDIRPDAGFYLPDTSTGTGTVPDLTCRISGRIPDIENSRVSGQIE
jgi:hypothetical protein